jgi:hypothetical protein
MTEERKFALLFACDYRKLGPCVIFEGRCDFSLEATAAMVLAIMPEVVFGKHRFIGPQTLPSGLRTGWQRQKLVRLISICDRFEVLVAASSRCNDYVNPLTSGSLHVEHVGPILDVRDGLVLRQFPTTAFWLNPTH